MPYCSTACQTADHAQHNVLCGTFRHFQEEHRPSPMHRRVIFFPQDEDRPRFVWLRYEGSAKCMTHANHDLERFVPDCTHTSTIDSHRELGRQYKNRFWMQVTDHSSAHALNQSLTSLLGPEAASWGGPIICMASLKYPNDTDFEDYDAEDQDEDYPDVRIPYDLDTTSLAIHLGYLRFIARYEHLDRMYGVQAQDIGDGFDPN